MSFGSSDIGPKATSQAPHFITTTMKKSLALFAALFLFASCAQPAQEPAAEPSEAPAATEAPAETTDAPATEDGAATDAEATGAETPAN